MRKEELIYNVKMYANQLIDDMIPIDSFIGKIENRTMKYWVEQNQWRLDDILSVFTDQNGCIDEYGLTRQYEDILFENGELRVSINELIPAKYRDYLPNKIILFTIDDLYKMVGANRPN